MRYLLIFLTLFFPILGFSGKGGGVATGCSLNLMVKNTSTSPQTTITYDQLDCSVLQTQFVHPSPSNPTEYYLNVTGRIRAGTQPNKILFISYLPENGVIGIYNTIEIKIMNQSSDTSSNITFKIKPEDTRGPDPKVQLSVTIEGSSSATDRRRKATVWIIFKKEMNSVSGTHSAQILRDSTINFTANYIKP